MIISGRRTGWYDLKLWADLRQIQLHKYPFCKRCVNRGVTTVANVVNHIIPHKGDWTLFNNPDNLESVCKSCHDNEIQRQERIGYDNRAGIDGWPVDVNHPANKDYSDVGGTDEK